MLLFYLQLIETEEDQWLFTDIYDSYAKQMFESARKVLRNTKEAEDAVHNAFVGIIKNMDSIRNKDEEDIKMYVLKAAKNAALNICKRDPAYNGKHVRLNEETVKGCATEKDTLERLCDEATYEVVLAAVMSLGEPYSTVLHYHYVMEMDYKAIAETLDRKPATVRQQIHRGKEKLKKAIGEHDV